MDNPSGRGGGYVDKGGSTLAIHAHEKPGEGGENKKKHRKQKKRKRPVIEDNRSACSLPLEKVSSVRARSAGKNRKAGSNIKEKKIGPTSPEKTEAHTRGQAGKGRRG